MTQRCGIGFDVHPLKPNLDLILGGTKIPHHSGLQGHSDGDVLIHAIIDSLLGAAGLGDIGKHFPKNHPDLKNIKSTLMLSQTYQLLKSSKWRVINVDATIIAEKPRLAKFIPAIREQVSQDINVEKHQVNVKSTTNDGMGFIGRNEGIAAYAVVTLEEIR